MTDDELARLRGPVGLDLGGRNPSETALAIIAEVVAERYGGSGTPLVDKARAVERGRGRVTARRDESRAGVTSLGGGCGGRSRFGGGKLLARARRPADRPSTSSTPRATAGLDPIVIVVLGPPRRIDGRHRPRRRRVVTNPRPRRACRARSGSACGALDADEPRVDAAVDPAGRPAAGPAGGDPGARRRGRRTRTRRSSSRAMPTDGGAEPDPRPTRDLALADELAGDRGFGPVLGVAPGARPRRAGRRRRTRTSTRAPTSTGWSDSVEPPADVS